MEYDLRRFEAEIDMDSYLENYVDVDRFIECCKVCPNYGTVWSCPPYDFDQIGLWKAYGTVRVIGYQLTFSGERTGEEMIEAERKVKSKLGRELMELEAQIPGSMMLSAGSCDICRECARKREQPCCHPDLVRYSIESIGGNVTKTIEELCGIEIEWIENGKLPEHFVLVGGLLLQ